ncbi:hypothetical protein Hanom_Chr00s130277g01815071 [Helianthus anomalus]
MEIDSPSVCTLNRFSILDVEASAKCGFLVDDDSDLYPNDPFNQGLNEQLDPSSAGTSTSGRVLPKWNTAASTSTSVQDGVVDDLDVSDDDNGYDYGNTQAQKDAIRKRLTSKSQTVLAEVANNWEPGERDYFEDLCMELGLDPDFCIEDVAEDTNGSARFFSGLMKDPVVAKSNSLNVVFGCWVLICWFGAGPLCFASVFWSPGLSKGCKLIPGDPPGMCCSLGWTVTVLLWAGDPLVRVMLKAQCLGLSEGPSPGFCFLAQLLLFF